MKVKHLQLQQRNHKETFETTQSMTSVWDHLDVSFGEDLVNCIARITPSTIVQILALHKHSMFSQVPDPNLALILCIEDNPFNQKQSSFDVNGQTCRHLPFPMCSLALSLASVR